MRTKQPTLVCLPLDRAAEQKAKDSARAASGGSRRLTAARVI